jgi:cytochrome c oxidase assembly protein subunit 15
MKCVVSAIAAQGKNREIGSHQDLPWHIPLFLLFLVAFQAALGMWTVTLKLLPVVVMGHLLGGITIFALLCYFALQCSGMIGQNKPRWRFWINLGIVIVFCQIALGGWVSSNYAGVACIGFPRCNGVWLPTMYFSKGFNLFSPIGANYQGGILDNEARISIQLIHRIGALVTASYMLILSALLLYRVKIRRLRQVAVLAMGIVLLQCLLGIANVLYLLPLWIAVLHNGCAALLLASCMMMRYLTIQGAAHASR